MGRTPTRNSFEGQVRRIWISYLNSSKQVSVVEHSTESAFSYIAILVAPPKF